MDIDSNKIKTILESRGFFGASVTVLDETPSTNDLLKQKENTDELESVIALEQSRGKGRYGKTFLSPKDCGLYLSIATFKAPSPPFFLTPAVGLIVKDSIKAVFDIDCTLKYVNDLLVGGKKIVGILCESVRERYIIGIGVNIFSSPCLLNSGLNATSLLGEKDGKKERDVKINEFIAEIILRLKDFDFNSNFMTRYERECPSYSQTVYKGERKIDGGVF